MTGPSVAVWGRAKWELHVEFTLLNSLPVELSVYDMHVNVYHVSDKVLPLGMVIHRDRIELYEDNSILGDGKTYDLKPREMQHFDFVLETSLYDTLMTTIVFGIFVDCQYQIDGAVARRRLSSADIYLFQCHPSAWGRDKAHFVARNPDSINGRRLADPSDAAVQGLCDSLLEIYDLHHGSQTSPNDLSTVSVEDVPKLDVENWKIEQISDQRDVHGALLGRINQQSRRSGDLLRVCSFFGNAPIPMTLLAESYFQLTLALYDDLKDESLQEAITAFSLGRLFRMIFRILTLGLTSSYWKLHRVKDGLVPFQTTCRHLVESGLVLHDVDKNSFTIPSPVLELLVPQLSGRRSRRFIRLATRALDAVLPSSDPTNWSVLEEFVEAADHCISNVASSQDPSRELIIILVDLLEYFEVRGQHARTRELCRRAISISEYEFPDQQELFFYLLMAIASALSHLKSYDEAEHQIQRARSLFQESNDRENVIGRARCAIMLASVRRDRGRFQEAASLFEEVIRALGPYENEDSEFVAEVLEEYAGFLTSLGERARESEVRLKASAIRARHSS